MMNHRYARRLSLVGFLAAAALHAIAAQASDDKDIHDLPVATPDTQSEQDQAVEERSKRIVSDAVAALEATRQAIDALDENDSERALAQLEIATGKIELLVSRHPGVAALPVGLEVSRVDVVSSDEAIAKIVEQAKEALEDGRVQLARRLLDPVGSELVFTTTELPLAAYPAAMRGAAPLIEAGEFEEARAALIASLDTLIVRDEIVPLPVLRAEILIEAAEKKLNEPPVIEPSDPEKASSTAAEDDLTPAEMLAAARRHLHRASVLGYGEARDTYPDLAKRLESLEKELNEEPTHGWRSRLAKLRTSLEEYGSALLQ